MVNMLTYECTRNRKSILQEYKDKTLLEHCKESNETNWIVCFCYCFHLVLYLIYYKYPLL